MFTSRTVLKSKCFSDKTSSHDCTMIRGSNSCYGPHWPIIGEPRLKSTSCELLYFLVNLWFLLPSPLQLPGYSYAMGISQTRVNFYFFIISCKVLEKGQFWQKHLFHVDYGILTWQFYRILHSHQHVCARTPS